MFPSRARTALLLLACLAAACARDESEPVVREKRIALLDRVDLNGRFFPGGEAVRKFNRELDLTPRSCLVLPPGKTVQYQQVPIHGQARLVGWLGATRPGGSTLELWVDGTVIANRSVEALKRGWERVEFDLSGYEGQRVELGLRNRSSDQGDELYLADPAVLSAGTTITADQVRPLPYEEVVFDLIKQFDQARVVQQDPEQPVKLFDLNIDTEVRTKADTAKQVVDAAPDSEIRFTLSIPEGGYLDLAAFNLCLLGDDPGDVEYRLQVDGQDVFSVRSDFVNQASSGIIYDRLTRRAEIDLGPWAGQSVEFALSTRRLKEPSGPPGKYVWWDLKLRRRLLLPRLRSSREHPNLLVLCVDTLRADHLSCYGYPRKTTPHLDALADRALLFEQAYSTCSWTLPATASLLTGLHPNTHGVLGNLRSYLVDAITTLPEYLQTFGVTTAAFSANHLVCAAVNYDQGFEFFDEVQEDATGIHRDLFHWIEECGPFQFFGYVHYMEPHSPYSAPGEARQHFDPDYEEQRDFSGPLPELWRTGAIAREFTPEERQHLVDLYDAEIFFWDQQFRKLLDRLEALDLLDRTVIVITSDHGEEFFDHDGLGHGLTLYQEVLHVPLIVIDPRRPKGRRIAAPVSTAGLFNAATRLMGFEEPSFTQVPTFQPRGGGLTGHEQVYSSTESHTTERESRWASIIEGEHKLVRSMLEEGTLLFNLQNDPAEEHPLDPTFQQLKRRLEQQVLDWYRTTAEQFPDEWQPTSDEIERRFRELGYTGGGK